MPKKKAARIAALPPPPETAIQEPEPKGPHFLDLPLELRMEIYRHLKTPRKTPRKPLQLSPLYPRKMTRRTQRQETVSAISPRFTTSHSFPPEILLLSKAIHAEACNTLYRNIDWVFFVSGTREALGRQPDLVKFPVFDYIKKVGLRMGFLPWSGRGQDLHLVCSMIGKIPNIMQLDVSLDGCEHWYSPIHNNRTIDILSALPRQCDWTLLINSTAWETGWNPTGIRERTLKEYRIIQEKLKKEFGKEVAKKIVKEPMYY